MEKNKNSLIFGYIGAGLMLLALLFPYLNVSFAIFSKGLGLLFDMGKLGELNGLMYLISILGIGMLAYCAYVSFKTKTGYMNVSYACFAYFIVLFIMFFVLRSDITDQAGGSYGGFVSGLIKMGFGLFMPLLAGGAYFLAEKAAIREQADASNSTPQNNIEKEQKSEKPENTQE